jgi:5-oxoprolinase (ATP-hydrolysing)
MHHQFSTWVGFSADAALYPGWFERAFETEVGGVRLRAPMIAINTVAADGSYHSAFRRSTASGGPDSAGAEPGDPRVTGVAAPCGHRRKRVCGPNSAAAFSQRFFGDNGAERLDATVVAGGADCATRR